MPHAIQALIGSLNNVTATAAAKVGAAPRAIG
jgi:hypothetical protein